MKLGLLYLSLLTLLMQGMAYGVKITTTSLSNGTVGQQYSAVIETSGGCTPFKWTVTGTLPAGVTASPSSDTRSLNLSGTPTAAATDSFEVTVAGCAGHTSSESYGVTVQSATTDVALSWDASSSNDIAGYNVYRSLTDASWKKLNSALVPSTAYSDSTVIAGQTYYYAVTAVDTAGIESQKTPGVKVVVE